jgi:tetratricopeptide (TPR) repeat protein
MMLETLLQQAGPDTTVILVSDHGFLSDERRRETDGFKNPTSWHRQQGVVCMHGPGIKQGEILQGASLLDVTPTVLSLFGIAVGNDMDGRPWLEAFDREVQPERIPSWDEVSGESGCHPADRQEDTVAAAEAIRQLVALGYVDPPTDDIQATIERTKIDLKTNLAIALFDAGIFEQAIATWQELIELADQDEALINNYLGELARCHMQRGDFEESEKILENLLVESPGNVMVLFRLAQLKLRRGSPAAALGHLSQIDEAATNSITYHSLAAPAYLQLRLFGDAKSSYRKVLDFDPESAEAWSGLACIAVEEKEYQDACEFALQAVGLEHNQPVTHFHLGVALAQCGYRVEAIKALETCLLLAPRTIAAHQQLAELLAQDERNAEKAHWHLQRADELKSVAQ